MGFDEVTPGSQRSLREANRARVVAALGAHGRLTQVELVEITRMSRSTVSNVVKDLLYAGAVRTAQTSRNGRRAVQVSLVRGQGLVGAAHFSSRRLRLAIADASGEIVAGRSVPLASDNRADNELDRMVILLASMAEEIGASLSDLQSLGIAVAVPVNPQTGETPRLGVTQGWEGLNIVAALRERLSCPVVLGPEASLGALAEVRVGAGQGFQTVAYLHVGHTISAGFVIDGKPYVGSGVRYGQLGHVSFDGNGAICRCGNRGCLETLASGRALVSMFRDDSRVSRLSDLVETAIHGDPRTSRVISDAGRHIGVAAAAMCNLMDPQVLVVGGELAATGELLLGPLRHAMERYVLGGERGVPETVIAALAPRSALVGAIEIAADALPLLGASGPGLVSTTFDSSGPFLHVLDRSLD